jgi:hypothetical protein
LKVLGTVIKNAKYSNHDPRFYAGVSISTVTGGLSGIISKLEVESDLKFGRRFHNLSTFWKLLCPRNYYTSGYEG